MSLPRLTGQVIAFSRFWLARDVGLLISDGAVIELGARPFAMLAALLEARGRVVSTVELRELVWPGSTIDANTVQAQISAIRRALDDARDLIVTVAGRGYRFAGEIRVLDTPDAGLDLAAANAGSIAASLANSFAASEAAGPSATATLASSSASTYGATFGAAGSGFSSGFSYGAQFGARFGARFGAPLGTPLGARSASAPAAAWDAPLASRLATASATPSTPAFPALMPTSASASLRSQSIDPSPFIGRHAELSELLALVPTRRIVTLTGASGVGKTRLAIEAASHLGPQFPDGDFCAALASLAQPDRVANAIGAALGLEPAGDLTTSANLAAQIGERRLLLIVDHCDHLSEAAAALIDTLVANTTGLHVIATCESPLFIGGEATVPVAALRVPPEQTDETPATLATLDYDALRLLFTRLAHCLKAAASHAPLADVSQLAPTTFAAAALICRRVDGVPFALELAAATIAGQVRSGMPPEDAIVAFARELDTVMTHRSGGRRIVLPRAAIVHVMLDLSYAALEAPTRTMLRRLGIFATAFSHDAAYEMLSAFGSDYGLEPPEGHQLEHQLHTLMDAGLVNAVDCDGTLRLRLPPAVRRFALDALERNRESAEAGLHHAQFVARDMARRFGAGVAMATAHSRYDIDALRAALEWAVSVDKVELCTELLDNTAPIWAALALVDEYIGWVRAVLARVDSVSMRRIRDEMRLRAVLARALTLKRSASAEIVESWQRTYDLANICADTPYRLRALFCLVMCALDVGEIKHCRWLSGQFSEIAPIAHSPVVSINARRIEGIVTAYGGDFDTALRLLAPVVGLNDDADGVDEEMSREANAVATSYGLSLHLVARAIHAVTLWLVGEPQTAAPLRVTIRDPADESEPLACCIALSLACALAALDDDIALTESCAAALVTRARAAGVKRWLRVGLDFQLWLDARRGDEEAALRLIGGAAKRIARERVQVPDIAFIATLLPRIALHGAPEFAATLGATLRDAVTRSERTGELWYVPELLRLEAMVRLRSGDDPGTVRPLLERALQRARQHGAQRLALRISVDLEALEASAGVGLLRVR
ncbi:winged helix-turn-helix domain-containing protein [Paraburkholderia bryophila]|uniref:winged helix-turn-helix domain-containing protein n=1 Tax=Burkholderiaceae TaxID=119060 RepID=UPI00068E6B62|nr:winged helix-turn-helix domain-containing protein [Burkholderia sp. 9120]